jgi:hypothetical protein
LRDGDSRSFADIRAHSRGSSWQPNANDRKYPRILTRDVAKAFSIALNFNFEPESTRSNGMTPLNLGA